MTASLYWWIGFTLFIALAIFVDLLAFSKEKGAISIRKALWWTLVWVIFAILFGLGMAFGWIGGVPEEMRQQRTVEFFTGYLIEKALSMENLFVFALLFNYFKVPTHYQHRVLFWGVLGALLMRAVLIFAGIALIERFHWIIYVFGGILILSGIKMLRGQKDIHPEKNPLFRLLHSIFPITKEYVQERFFTRIDGKIFATPLFIVLVLIEWTDLIFAVDSIPAILAVTQDSFIVYTSNVFAILGMRSLYFALGGLLGMFRFLHYGLSCILILIGIKMMLTYFFHIPLSISLSIIILVIILSVTLSILIPAKKSS